MSIIGDAFRDVHAFFFGHPMKFSFVDDNVAGSARPSSAKSVAWLQQKKTVASILSLTEQPLPKSWVVGFDYRNVAVRNHRAPTMGQLKECIDYIFSENTAGRKVLVHCAAGEGRTGTILACYLCAKYGKDPKTAIEEIRKARSRSVEKNEQEEAVYKFAASIRNK